VGSSRIRELMSLAQLIPCGGSCLSGFKSLTWHVCSYFPGFISGFNGVVLSVVGDVPVDSETSVVTLK